MCYSVSEDEDGENENGETAGGVYKLKYERVARELEFTKRRLQTQHEHDLEQLVGLKKQLEKKVSGFATKRYLFIQQKNTNHNYF